ncbi:UDP-glucose 4-epimerase [Thermosipho melanesiensis]|uniref:NAD-dependent epimerase/dehydratase n=2 Tax=Thermosipho melanesiensis TaxID=46541 RepID=A6LJD1_THEM4|nr:SDR family NAD(P)-dependent oxidoreductase [Thermosipho melanesiensis]ABR30032.1 NAD-dependent epimerase/dehydratase [Thermosipho melanesiensis BI429]APT73233.1 UDP-glucose 4-epimerase [Thermosipho melanesiensis]OOC38626.1 UDP-glucose 4-epimerase [Thermosipho melanesiensis]OOC40430.1 UDP-glucose 4-epimerase [Thermosipho melanesiensis]OOC40695.1 UDP-glucose 4-epimerase [Thermosipho melanesiensis]
MKTLVTGGAGFIGSHVVDKLVQNGFEVVVLDNLSKGKKENVNEKAKLIVGDIKDKKAMEELFENENFDYVFHLAAQASVSVSVKDPVEDANVNIIGSLNLINLSIKHGVKKFIFSSTGGAIYGDDVEIYPTPESVCPKPISPYGIAKLSVENYLRFAKREFNLDYTVLRYANVYGPRQDPFGEAGVIAIFISRMLNGDDIVINGDGGYVRDYVYVEDVANANLRALKSGSGLEINIGTSVGTSVNQLFGYLKKIIRYDKEPIYGPPRKGDIRKSILCYTRALEELRWKPTVDIEKGLRLTVEWFKRNFKT